MSPLFEKLATRSADEKDELYNPNLEFYKVDIDPDEEAPGVEEGKGPGKVAEICHVSAVSTLIITSGDSSLICIDRSPRSTYTRMAKPQTPITRSVVQPVVLLINHWRYDIRLTIS